MSSKCLGFAVMDLNSPEVASRGFLFFFFKKKGFSLFILNVGGSGFKGFSCFLDAVLLVSEPIRRVPFLFFTFFLGGFQFQFF